MTIQFITSGINCNTYITSNLFTCIYIQGWIQELARKGRGTNRLSCRWVGRTDSLAGCFIFFSRTYSSLSVSLLIFAILGFTDSCEIFKLFTRL